MTERKSTPKRHWLIIAAVLAIAVLIGTIVYFLDDMRGRATGPSSVVGGGVSDPEILLYDGGKYRLNEDIETVLVMGLDKFEEERKLEGGSRNYQQADFLLLLLLDRANGVCVPLHINRDTMCLIWSLDIYGEPLAAFNGQIALAHAYGSGGKDSCRNQARAVSDLLYGRKIDHYVSLTMDAVSIVNDMAGGVTVTVLDDFSKLDKSLVQGEEVTLMGDQALTYVRARYSMEDSSNLSRMERQRQYLAALRDKLTAKTKTDPNFPLKVMTAVSDGMVSDCSVYEMADIVSAMTEYTFTDFQTIAGEAVKGEEFMEYYADEDALYQQVIDLFYLPVEED